MLVFIAIDHLPPIVFWSVDDQMESHILLECFMKDETNCCVIRGLGLSILIRPCVANGQHTHG